MCHYAWRMGRNANRAKVYAVNLRAELGQQNVAVRELARRLEAPAPPRERIETRRRWLNKVLKAEFLPSPPNREAIAECLGVAYSALEPGDDDEESQAVAASLAEVLTLMVDRAVAKAATRSAA